MSPVELRREFDAANARRTEQEKRDVALAWYTAAFTRQEKLKPLPAVLAPLERATPRYRQTRAEQLAAMAAISAQWGIQLQVKKSQVN